MKEHLIYQRLSVSVCLAAEEQNKKVNKLLYSKTFYLVNVKKVGLFCQPVRGKSKTNCDSPMHISLHSTSATCICFKFWLDHGTVCVLCDWPGDSFGFGFTTFFPACMTWRKWNSLSEHCSLVEAGHCWDLSHPCIRIGHAWKEKIAPLYCPEASICEHVTSLN